MKPIISPWWIYLIDLFDNLKGLLGVALFLLGGAAVALLIIWFFSSLDYEQDEGPIVACKKYLKKSVIWLCVSGLLFTVIPSKDTMYTMIVLDNVTTDNIQAIGKTGKDIIDYITDQIDKIVNDKEENKKS
ncbi:hypothetical protein DW955_03245 [Ruminococcus sp. AM45-9BH]|jgi:hypothetical protein|nr:hypothetical protein DW955_03245 [Ruminococcus sp. AM45-9BH]RHS76906.1 hypothetical protein DW953_04775 [Ruminococcus sp. AM45-2]